MVATSQSSMSSLFPTGKTIKIANHFIIIIYTINNTSCFYLSSPPAHAQLQQASMELATPPQNAHLRGERQGRFDVMTTIMDMMAMMVNIIINIKLISSRGSCASSFGVCCVFSLACGSTSSEVGYCDN